METAETPPDDQQLGQYAPALLSTEHWSLLSARSLIWSGAQSRGTVFLTLRPFREQPPRFPTPPV